MGHGVIEGTVFSLVLLGCSPESSSPPAAEPDPSNAPPVVVEDRGEEAAIDARFTETLLAATNDYPNWGRVDERPSVAPTDCAAPGSLDGFPSHARRSGADEAPHGEKLYFLFAGQGKRSAREQYTSLGKPSAEAIPVGFAIVKQSWTAVPNAMPTANAAPEWSDTPAPITFVEHEGGRLYTGERAELFVMAKVGAPDMPGTDAGWIYGTLSPDGRGVTSAGRVQTCMDCHEAAPHDRLFGLQKTKILMP